MPLLLAGFSSDKDVFEHVHTSRGSKLTLDADGPSQQKMVSQHGNGVTCSDQAGCINRFQQHEGQPAEADSARSRSKLQAVRGEAGLRQASQVAHKPWERRIVVPAAFFCQQDQTESISASYVYMHAESRNDGHVLAFKSRQSLPNT